MKINRMETITGFLQLDPELRFTPGGHAVCRLYVIVDGTGEIRYCDAWRELAESLAQFDRGDRFTFTGQTKTQSWKDLDDVEHSRDVFEVRSYTVIESHPF